MFIGLAGNIDGLVHLSDLSWTETGEEAVSDYLFRGISQTQAKPTAQATLDFTHSSGFYLGLFGSGVSHAAYNNGAGSELDVYGGYRHSVKWTPPSNARVTSRCCLTPICTTLNRAV